MIAILLTVHMHLLKYMKYIIIMIVMLKLEVFHMVYSIRNDNLVDRLKMVMDQVLLITVYYMV